MLQLYFGTSKIGTFKQIVEETGLPNDLVRQYIVKNGRSSILKDRHVEIAKILRAQGFSCAKIARVLSDIEGFPIHKVVVEQCDEVMKGSTKLSQGATISKKNIGKNAEIANGEILLYKTDHQQKNVLFGKIPINDQTSSGKEYQESEKVTPHISQDVINKIVTQLYNNDISPKKIVPIISQISEVTFTENNINGLLQKLKAENGLQIKPAGFFHKKENIEKKASIEGSNIQIFITDAANNSSVIDTINIIDGSPAENAKINPISKSFVKQVHSSECKYRPNLLDIYIRYLWHSDPVITHIKQICERINNPDLALQDIRDILSKNQSQGALKDCHLNIMKKLYDKGFPTSEIRSIINEVTGLDLSSMYYSQKLYNLKQSGAVPEKRASGKKGATKDAIDAALKDEKGADAAAAFGKQIKRLHFLITATKQSLRQICSETGLTANLIRAIAVYGCFNGNFETLKQRFRKSIDPQVVEKIVFFTKYSELTLQEIAGKCKCGRNTVRNYALNSVFFGNKELFAERFTPDPLTPDKEEKAIKAYSNLDKGSLATLARESGLSLELFKQVIIKRVYHGDADAFATMHPELKPIDERTVQQIVDLVTHSKLTMEEIAEKVGVAQGTVQKVALRNVYESDLGKYEKRFEARHYISDDMKKRVIIEILNGTLNLQQIAIKFTANGEPISVHKVSEIAAEAISDPVERAKRFPGDMSKHVSKWTHVIFETILERYLEEENIQVFREVSLPSPDTRWSFVRIDCIVPMSQADIQQRLDQIGPEGWPLWEELGLAPEQIREIEEILFEFTANLSDYNLSEKREKYTKDGNKTGAMRRFVFIVATSPWFWEEQVRPLGERCTNARVVSFDFFANLLKLNAQERAILRHAIENAQNLDLEAQRKLAQKHGCEYSDDTEKYWKVKGEKRPVFDHPDPQQTLDNYLSTNGKESSNRTDTKNGPNDAAKNKLPSNQADTKTSKEIQYDLEINGSQDCEPQEDTPVTDLEIPTRTLDEVKRSSDKDRAEIIAAADEIALVPFKIDEKQPVRVTDAERAAIIAAADEIARVPFKIDEKPAVPVSDATRAGMIAAPNAIARAEFPLDMPEHMNDKQEQKQDASDAQDRSIRGVDRGRAR